MNIEDAYAKIAYLGEGLNQKEGRYEKYFVVDMEYGLGIDFSSVSIGEFGYYSLVEVDGNVYLLDISSITYTSSSDGNNIWYLTEDAVKFASNGSSAEALFKALAGKGKFVTYSGGKYVESTSGTSTVEANFGRDGKWRLIKKINPSIEESFYLIPRMENKDTTGYSNSTLIWI